MGYKVINNDVIKWAAEYDGPKFHSMLADPPYHLTSITKRFGANGAAPAKFGKDGAFSRASAGFMGQKWDGGELVFQPETWAALAQHLYPGAFGMAYASSRGWHRMAVAIEDAGLIIHPSIFMMGWSYLSGFPKATKVKGYGSPSFSGHRYGLQALKPALEPIIMFQVPYKGRPVDNIVESGAGSLNIDGGRIPTNGETPKGSGNPCPNGNADIMSRALGKDGPNITPDSGRWPANLLMQHNPGCTDSACEESCAIAMLDRQSGELTSGGPAKGRDNFDDFWQGKKGIADNPDTYNGGDSGPASRMFYRADWNYETLERLENADPVHYQPKASTAEREAGLASLETKTRHRVNAGGLENEPRFAPTQVKNNHPTVKSISLNKYLATLLLPPAEYAPRRILVPFSGVSSEMIGAVLAGWDDVTGIEQGAGYCQIANARLAWWADWLRFGQSDPKAILAAEEVNAAQTFMFA